MKNDIIPPKLPKPAAKEQKRLSPPEEKSPDLLTSNFPPLKPLTEPATSLKKPERSRSWVKWLLLALVGIAVFVAALVGGWYFLSLRPIDADDTSRERVSISPGSSLSAIGDMLEEKKLIRDSFAFTIHARLSGAGARLQAGTYSLSPSESAREILKHFTTGSVDKVSITFLPGATLRRLPGETSANRTDVESALLNAGYSQQEIDAAFEKTYAHPLLADKPTNADLEGYIYGETYMFSGSSTVEQILEQTFDEYYRVIEQNNLIEGLKAKGFTLHEGITLASIIQREVLTPEEQRQVAQIFLSRMKLGMSLGSDVTYQYAAKKAGVPPNPNLDSPYNTRKFTGLPPGPIGMPGLGALQAVANPASGDYLYFVSGDDDKTYYARTIEEHEANVRAHCREKCSVF